MPTPLENARKRLATLEAEAQEIRHFIAMYGRFSDANVSGSEGVQLPNSEETYPQETQPVDSGDNVRRRSRSGPVPRELAEIMERLIREVGRPMTRGEIVDALGHRDIEVPAKDKSRYIGTIAWRNKTKFVNIEGRGYWLRGEYMQVPGIEPNTPYSDPPPETADELPEGDAELFT